MTETKLRRYYFLMTTILIVDDGAEDRKALEMLVKNHTGHQVLTAGTGREALALAPRADLVLLDVNLPDSDGIEVFNRLRSESSTLHTPVIFLTAFPSYLDGKIAGKMGGTVDYLVKPVDKEKMLNQIELLLGIRQARGHFRSREISEADQLTLLLAALEQTGDGVTVTDWNGRWLFVNHSQAKLFGYSSQEFLNLTVDDLYFPESSNLIRNKVIPRLQDSSHWEGELQARKKGGDAFPVLLSLAVIKNDSGRFLGIMGITKNISEIKQALESLKQAQDELVRTERIKALSEMVGGMAHEFNNLLAIILGNAQIMLQNVKEPIWQKRLRAIERAAFTGAEEVKRLQTFAFPRQGEAIETLDLKEILDEALQFSRPRCNDLAQQKGVRIKIESDFRPALLVRANREELKMAFSNIVFNAIDALVDGGRIEVKSWPEGAVACVQIQDNGAGMTPEVKKRVFEPFFTTLRPLKTGLGLSMSYGIINKLNGTIEIESEPRRGTTVTVRLPLVSPAEEKAPPLPAGELGEKKAGRILIIDNDPNILDVLADILSQAGFEVRVQASSPAGLKEALDSDFKLVITDLGMPEIDGLAIARRIKSGRPETRVALITGWWISLEPEEISRSGVDAVWSKPFDLKVILREVKRLTSAAYPLTSGGESFSV